MPPKAGKGSKKKAEELARQAEEARLAALLEEERLERERLEREEELKRLAEEKRQWLETETRRMEEEREEHIPLLASRTKDLVAEEGKREAKEEWDNFIACTHLPDFRQDSELSTFITLWEEEPDRDLEQVLKETQQACDVLEGLEKMTAQAMGLKKLDLADKYRSYMQRIRELIKFKLDHASAEMLEHLQPYTDPKDGTCQHSVPTALQKFGMWVNTTRNVRIKTIEYPNLGLKTDIPRTIILQTVAVRMMHFRKDIISPFISGDYFTMGGVLFIECLEVPDAPKPIKSHVPDVKDSGNWMYIKITDKKGEVERQAYPPIDPVTGEMQSVGVPPMKVDWVLPADVLIPEGAKPIVGWWDERIVRDEGGEKGGWNDEGISDIELSPPSDDGERTLSFSTMYLTALAILQCRWACFPFQSWTLQPMAKNRSMLNLYIKGDFNFKFEIGSGLCRLVFPADESLRPLREKPLPPMELLRRLLHFGINLIPSDQDAPEVSIADKWDCTALMKTRELEARVCQGLSMLAPAFSMSHSTLNPTLGPKDATVKVVQTTDDPTFRTLMFRQAPTENDLDYCFLCPQSIESASKSSVHEELGIGQIYDSDDINLTPPTVGLETRCFPLTAVKEIGDDLAISRCEQSSPAFTESVRIMLEVLRLFSFCAPPMPAVPEEPAAAAQGEGGATGEAAEDEGAEGAESAEGGGGAASAEGGSVEAAPGESAAAAAAGVTQGGEGGGEGGQASKPPTASAPEGQAAAS